MSTEPSAAAVSKGLLWAGRIVTGLTVLFLLFDSVAKIVEVPAVVQASAGLGLPANTVAGIGIVLLACTLIYVIPRTAVLGAILLTGYLGGAVAIQVRVASGLFPVAFSALFGVLVWVGLVLREPRLFRTIFLRQW